MVTVDALADAGEVEVTDMIVTMDGTVVGNTVTTVVASKTPDSGRKAKLADPIPEAVF